jgi:hypothetical protein
MKRLAVLRSTRHCDLPHTEVCDADQHIEEGLLERMEKHEYESVQQMNGSMSQIRCPHPSAFERAQYMKAVKRVQHVMLTSRKACGILSSD